MHQEILVMRERSGKVTVRHIITNLTSRQVTLFGSACSCSCTLVEPLPPSLSPSESVGISATIEVPRAGRSMGGNIKLFTDDPVSPELLLTYSGRIVSTD